MSAIEYSRTEAGLTSRILAPHREQKAACGLDSVPHCGHLISGDYAVAIVDRQTTAESEMPKRYTTSILARWFAALASFQRASVAKFEG